jgi:hypothetical protein
LAFSYWIDYLGFITEGKLDAVLITPSLGVPNWSVIYIINTAPASHNLFFIPIHEHTSGKSTFIRILGVRHCLQASVESGTRQRHIDHACQGSVETVAAGVGGGGGGRSRWRRWPK